MLSRSEDVEAHALSKRGWSISAIARHLECDRKTVRSYLAGDRTPGLRRSSAPDPLAPFASYVAERFVDDPHLWASALFDEVTPLGYSGSYVSFARQLRLAGLRPHCEACSGVKGRETTEIEHPSGEEIQWDWAERRKAPWGGTAYLLLGTLSHSGRTRSVLTESMDQPHLIEAMDEVMRRLGGTAPSAVLAPCSYRAIACQRAKRSLCGLASAQAVFACPWRVASFVVAFTPDLAPRRSIRRPPCTTVSSSEPPSACTYWSRTSIVTLRDCSMAATRGWDTPMRFASSRWESPASSRRAVRPAARRSSSSIAATRSFAPSTARTFFSQSRALIVCPYLSFRSSGSARRPARCSAPR